MKRLLPVVASLLLAVWFGLGQPPEAPHRKPAVSSGQASQALAEAFERQQSDIQVEGRGTVVKLLADDRDGSRHQRFLIRLESGQTILIAHNIDLAPRIASLAAGDEVGFYGEYEWNPKGGVIHWTHHDPAGRHPDGWVRHRERIYQ